MSSVVDVPNLTAESLMAVFAMIERFEREGGDGEHEGADALLDLKRALLQIDPLPLVRPLTVEEVAHFRECGWVELRGLFDEWVAPMRESALAIIDTPGPARYERRWHSYAGRSARNDRAAYLSPVQNAVATFGPPPRIARALLGEGPMARRGVAVFVKDAPTAYGSPWHVDLVDPPGRPDRGLHIWVALDDGAEDSGSLQLISGSHLWTDREREERLDPEIVKRIDAGELPAPTELVIPGLRSHGETVIKPTLRAGDVLAFDSRMVHGAAGNRSDRSFVSAATLWFVGLIDEPVEGGEL